MGCANAKPESHTKKQPLNQNPPTTKPSTLNTSFENPEIKNQVKQITKQNSVSLPKIYQNTKTSPNSQKISDIKVPTIEKEQLKQRVQSQEKQSKHQLSQIKKQTTEQVVTKNQTPNRKLEQSIGKTVNGLETISQRKQQSQMTKKVTESKLQPLRQYKQSARGQNKQSARQSSDIPDMNEHHMVSNISKPNQSVQHINQPQSHSKKQNDHYRQMNDITAEEIKINVMGENKKFNDQSLLSEDFKVLAEEQFDLNCQFDPNVLVIDMNKVAW